MTLKLRFMLSAAVTAALGGLNQVYAADASSSASAPSARKEPALEEIVVTAERRATSIQKTALQITALSGEDISRQPLTDILQLSQRQPEILFTQSVGILRTAIRGVGAVDVSLGADPRVAFHTDGVYVARGSAQAASLFDIDRLEVVSGPQGTLYGRNATGGAINVITIAPGPDFSGYVDQTFGNYGLFKTDAAVNIPVNQDFSLRVAGQLTKRDGFGKDVFLNEDIGDLSAEALRVRARWTKDRLQVDLIGDFYDRRDHNASGHTAGFIGQPTTPLLFATAILPTNVYENSGDQLGKLFVRTYGIALKGKYDLTDHLVLQSLSGYRNNTYRGSTDADGTNVAVFYSGSREQSETFSQEFQLNGDFNKTKFTVGAYGFAENLFGATDVALAHQPGIDAGGGFDPIALLLTGKGIPDGQYFEFTFSNAYLQTRNFAFFGQITQDLTDKLHLTLGGRYSWEQKQARRAQEGLTLGTPLQSFTDPAIYSIPASLYRPEEHETWTSFTPRISLQYDITQHAMAYATWAKGFKSGAYGLADVAPPVNPEQLEDIEGGIKTTWFGGRLLVNASAYYYKYKNMQVNVLENLVLVTKNAGRSHIYGGELNIEGQITERLRLGATMVLTRSVFDNFMSGDATRPQLGTINLKGLHLPQAPDYRYAFSADYTVPIDRDTLIFHVQSILSAKYYLTPFNVPQLSAPPSKNVDASVSYDWANGLSASLWVNNLTDDQVPTEGFGTSSIVGGVFTAAYTDPRTFGATIGYKW